MKISFTILIYFLVALGAFTQQFAEDTIFELEGRDTKQLVRASDKLIRDINEIFNAEPERIELYLQDKSSDSIRQVINYDKAPMSFYASYNIIRDEAGEIIYINEVPNLSSAKEYLSFDYYYASGNLIAYTRFSSTSNAKCAEVVNEESTWYYDPQHTLIRKTYMIYDQRRRLLDQHECIFNREPHAIAPTLHDYFTSHHFLQQ
jgi:hypothetical protein